VREISPEPAGIRIDEDGNYLARYNLGPKEKKDITWEGWAALYHPPRQFNNEKAESIPQALIDTYTRPAKYWEADDPAVLAKAQELSDPNLPVAQNAERIFDFVSEYLTYDYTTIAEGNLTRLGAAEALKNEGGTVCMEYTDLFVALARAAGIPARAVEGFAYTTNEPRRPISFRLESGDILHAWPEVYLPKMGWVMLDPAWGATSESDYFSTFDLAHIAFVRKGLSSEYPLPAGNYKTDPSQQDVNVSFSSEVAVVNKSPQLSVEIIFPPLSISPFPTNATIRIKNPTGATAFNTQVTLTSDLLQIDGDKIINLGTIPAGGAAETKVRLVPTSSTTRGTQTLKVTAEAAGFNGETAATFDEEQTTVNPLYLPLPLPYLACLAIAAALSTRLAHSLLNQIRTH